MLKRPGFVAAVFTRKPQRKIRVRIIRIERDYAGETVFGLFVIVLVCPHKPEIKPAVRVSRVYKHEGRYFLMLQNETPDTRTTDDLEAVLFEYGEKHVSNYLAKQYLTEHGEVLIKDDAVEKLAVYIS